MGDSKICSSEGSYTKCITKQGDRLVSESIDQNNGNSVETIWHYDTTGRNRGRTICHKKMLREQIPASTKTDSTTSIRDGHYTTTVYSHYNSVDAKIGETTCLDEKY